MIQYLYLGRVPYDEGLRFQAELVDLRLRGRVDNVLLLLEQGAEERQLLLELDVLDAG